MGGFKGVSLCFGLGVGQDQARAQAELLRRQEELEKKAAELDRRERELQTHGGAGQSLNHTLLYLFSVLSVSMVRLLPSFPNFVLSFYLKK